MQWTRTPPMETGWYWYQSPDYGPGVIYFLDGMVTCGPADFAFCNGDLDYTMLPPEAEWAGPIPEPRQLSVADEAATDFKRALSAALDNVLFRIAGTNDETHLRHMAQRRDLTLTEYIRDDVGAHHWEVIYKGALAAVVKLETEGLTTRIGIAYSAAFAKEGEAVIDG